MPGAAGRQLCEEGDGLGHGALVQMDDQLDGSSTAVTARMVVEHEAVDADDRPETPPACGVVGVAAVAEEAEDVFEGIALQPLRLRAPVPWMETFHGYFAGGVSRSGLSALPARRRALSSLRLRRSALRRF